MIASMKIEIVSPEKTLFSGEVESVTLPGTKGKFTMLDRHAPIISSLEKGSLTYKEVGGKEDELSISGGFVEMNNNVVSVCIDGLEK